MNINYFSSPEECKKKMYKTEPTNPRYPSFKQTHFTVGDEQQFEEYRNKSSFYNYPIVPSVHDERVWSKFQHLTPRSVSNTFRYMFHKFKKGIFIQIKDNRVSVFLPFSKHHFTNEWSERIRVDPQYPTMMDFFKHVQIRSGRRFQPKFVDTSVERWYSNNALVRYEYPISENDSGVHMIADMFEQLCATYTDIPDIEVFVNKRDHPLIREDGCEPYDHLFGDECPLVSHNYDTYTPILSMCSRKGFSDIMIPTWDDWVRVSVGEGKYFPRCDHYNHYDVSFSIPWEEKYPTAVFRGSSTGFGTDISTNPRLKISKMNLEHRIDPTDGVPLLDAGIVSWNVRPRIVKDGHILTTLHEDVFQIPLVQPLPFTEQQRYKYIVHIEGHTAAYRISRELGSGSVLLIVDSKFKTWVHEFIRPWVHYIPVSRDLEDLYDTILWCKRHDTECQRIVDNARYVFDTYLQKPYILEHLHNTLHRLKSCGGTYRYIVPLHETVYQLQRRTIDTTIHHNPQRPPFFTLPDMYDRRMFPVLQSMEWCIRSLLPELLSCHRVEFYKNKNTLIQICTIYNNIRVIEKSIHSPKELTNEFFVGWYGVNTLIRDIPNFIYTFLEHDGKVYMEYIPQSQSLFEYIKTSFVMDEFIHLLVQIALALHTAQTRILFVHQDLYPWNILVYRTPKPILVHYPLENGEYYRIQTSCIPVLIDYGKSSCVYRDTLFSSNIPKRPDTIHDILCLLVSGMYTVLHYNQLVPSDLCKVFTLTSFFVGGEFSQFKTFNTVKSLKQFLHYQKKYSRMLETPKGHLTSKTPLDVVYFIIQQFGYPLTKVSCKPLEDYKTICPQFVFRMCTSPPTEHNHLVNEHVLSCSHKLSRCVSPFDTFFYIRNLIFVHVHHNVSIPTLNESISQLVNHPLQEYVRHVRPDRGIIITEIELEDRYDDIRRRLQTPVRLPSRFVEKNITLNTLVSFQQIFGTTRTQRIVDGDTTWYLLEIGCRNTLRTLYM